MDNWRRYKGHNEAIREPARLRIKNRQDSPESHRWELLVLPSRFPPLSCRKCNNFSVWTQPPEDLKPQEREAILAMFRPPAQPWLC